MEGNQRDRQLLDVVDELCCTKQFLIPARAAVLGLTLARDLQVSQVTKPEGDPLLWLLY